MKNITLGRTEITAPQNGFGALPVQRVSKDTAVALLRREGAGPGQAPGAAPSEETKRSGD